jgi:ParB/RepB/Spo0J family partition protein
MPELLREVYEPSKFKLLKADVKEHGISNPLHVIKDAKAKDHYECFIGIHRLKCAKEIPERRFVPAIIENIPRDEAIAKGFRDNELTVPMNAMDKYKTIQALSKNGLTYSEIAKLLFGSEERLSTVKQMIRLGKLPIPVQNRVKEGAIDWSNAIFLLELEDEDKIIEACEEAVAGSYNQRVIREKLKNDEFGESESKPSQGLPTRCFMCGELISYKNSRSRQICNDCLKDAPKTLKSSLTNLQRNSNPKTLEEFRAEFERIERMRKVEEEMDAKRGRQNSSLTNFSEGSLTNLPEPRPKAKADTTWTDGLDENQRHWCIVYATQREVSLREARNLLLSD